MSYILSHSYSFYNFLLICIFKYYNTKHILWSMVGLKIFSKRLKKMTMFTLRHNVTALFRMSLYTKYKCYTLQFTFENENGNIKSGKLIWFVNKTYRKLNFNLDENYLHLVLFLELGNYIYYGNLPLFFRKVSYYSKYNFQISRISNKFRWFLSKLSFGVLHF